jgi:hypothetical protein
MVEKRSTTGPDWSRWGPVLAGPEGRTAALPPNKAANDLRAKLAGMVIVHAYLSSEQVARKTECAGRFALLE